MPSSAARPPAARRLRGASAGAGSSGHRVARSARRAPGGPGVDLPDRRGRDQRRVEVVESWSWSRMPAAARRCAAPGAPGAGDRARRRRRRAAAAAAGRRSRSSRSSCGELEGEDGRPLLAARREAGQVAPVAARTRCRRGAARRAWRRSTAPSRPSRPAGAGGRRASVSPVGRRRVGDVAQRRAAPRPARSRRARRRAARASAARVSRRQSTICAPSSMTTLVPVAQLVGPAAASRIGAQQVVALGQRPARRWPSSPPTPGTRLGHERVERRAAQRRASRRRAACPRARTGRRGAPPRSACGRRGTPLTWTRLRPPPRPACERRPRPSTAAVADRRAPRAGRSRRPRRSARRRPTRGASGPCRAPRSASSRLVLPAALAPTTTWGPVGNVDLELARSSESAVSCRRSTRILRRAAAPVRS